MIFKSLKFVLIVAVLLCVAGGLVFGRELFSYAWSSVRSVRTAARESVPLEFELKRARDLLEDIIPEMQANIRLIAREEVEIADLKSELEAGIKAIEAERPRVGRLSSLLGVEQADYRLGARRYTRAALKEDLARRFDLLKEAEVVHAGKQRLLTAREKALQTAMAALERSRTSKVLLEDRVEALASRHRLVQAAAAGSRFATDNTKLAQTEKLLAQIKKRLDIAERVLAHESRFVQPIEVDEISERDLVAEVKDYLSRPSQGASPTGEQLSCTDGE